MDQLIGAAIALISSLGTMLITNSLENQRKEKERKWSNEEKIKENIKAIRINRINEADDVFRKLYDSIDYISGRIIFSGHMFETLKFSEFDPTIELDNILRVAHKKGVIIALQNEDLIKGYEDLLNYLFYRIAKYEADKFIFIENDKLKTDEERKILTEKYNTLMEERYSVVSKYNLKEMYANIIICIDKLKEKAYQ